MDWFLEAFTEYALARRAAKAQHTVNQIIELKGGGARPPPTRIVIFVVVANCVRGGAAFAVL